MFEGPEEVLKRNKKQKEEQKAAAKEKPVEKNQKQEESNLDIDEINMEELLKEIKDEDEKAYILKCNSFVKI
jgi:hypothetical protein